MAINIDLVADVKDVIRGTDRIGDALEDLAGDLQDLGRDSERAADAAGDALGDGFTDGAREAERALERVEDSLVDAGAGADRLESEVSRALRSVADDSRTAGRTIGDTQRAGFREASAGAETFRDEADANAKEVAASFDGSAESILDGFQGLAAEMFSGFGPAGMVAGVAMAAGIGMAVTAFQEGAEKATAMKEKAVDMVDKIAEAGGDISNLDLADTIKEWGREVLEDNWITFWADEASTKFQETAKDAREFGIDAGSAVRAAAGSAEDSRKFLAATADEWQKLNAVAAQGRTDTESGLIVYDDAAQAALKQKAALSDLRGQAEENLKTTADAVDIYNIEAEALSGLTDEVTANAVKLRDVDKAKESAAEEEANLRAYVDGTTEAYERNTAALEKSIDAIEGGITSELDYLDGVAELTKTLEENGRTVDLNTAKGRDNRRAIVDQAATIRDMAAASVEAGGDVGEVTAKFNAQKDALVKQVTPAFGGSKEAARAYIEQLLKTPPVVKTQVQLDDEAAQAKIANLERRRTMNLQVLPDGTEVEKWFRSQQGRKIFIEYAPRGGGQAAALP